MVCPARVLHIDLHYLLCSLLALSVLMVVEVTTSKLHALCVNLFTVGTLAMEFGWNEFVGTCDQL